MSSVDALVQKFRDQMDDNELPYLWEEERIIDWLDEAQRDFARVTHIFKAKTSPALTITTGDPYVTLPDDFIEFRLARTVTANHRITNMNMNEVENAHISGVYGEELTDDWITATGNPSIILLDVEMGKGRLVPIPTTDDTMEMYYVRYPKKVTASSSKVELTNEDHQRLLVVFARAMAYDDNDSDVYDPRKAEALMAEFNTKTLKYASENRNSTRRAGTVGYGGY